MSFRARVPRVIPSATRNLPSPLMGEGQGEGDRGGNVELNPLSLDEVFAQLVDL